MFRAFDHPSLVPFDGSFRLADAATTPWEGAIGKREYRDRLEELVEELEELQRRLYADDRWSVLLVFQAMDAAGKDGTIRAVTSGVDPSGFQVSSFKAPGPEAIDHDFLWRTTRRLPERGRIGIFNRSYYEEVLVVRVHQGFLDHQRLPVRPPTSELWEQRLDSIRDHELHLARNGTVVVKFWLNVSKAEQAGRFLARLEEREKNWKFSARDVAERDHWDEYMTAYEAALQTTSRPWAPWYAVPADDKRSMRLIVAEIVVESLRSLDLHYPKVDQDERAGFGKMRQRLEREIEDD